MYNYNMTDREGFEVNKNNQQKKLFVSTIVFLILFLPTLIFGIYYYRSVNDTMTGVAILQRQTVASLSASAIKLKLDHIVGVAQAFAANKQVKLLVSEGQWEEAISECEILSNQEPFYDYYIDRIKLLDTKGNVWAAFPKLNGGVGGVDTTIGEWLSSLLAGKEEFYVSNAYSRTAEPRINVVEVIVPVVNNNSIIGIIALQVPINDFSDFGKDVGLGSNGFAYIVDRLGHIIAHPKISSDGPIFDYSSIPAVKNFMQGREEAIIAYNTIEQQERLSVDAIVPIYGWGVISTESAQEAFQGRDSILSQIIYLIVIFSMVELVIAFLAFLTQNSLQKGNFYK